MGKIQMRKRQSTSAPNEQTIQACYDLYIKTCKTKGYSAATIKYYDNTIRNFSLFFDLRQKIDSLSEETVKDYYLYLKEKNLAENTIKTYIAGLRTILYAFMDEGWLERFKVIVPKAEDTIKEIYTPEELEKLLVKPNMKQCSFAEYRNWVLVSFFIGTGQRLSTVINIQNKDVNLESEIIVLKKTKGKKQSIIPISPSLVRILEEYMDIREGAPEEYLFCTQEGKQLSKDGITSAIQKYNNSRGVHKTSIHLFRHSFATNYLQNGGNIFDLKKLLLHADLESTEKYLNSTVEDLKSRSTNFNPLERTIKKNISMKRGKRV